MGTEGQFAGKQHQRGSLDGEQARRGPATTLPEVHNPIWSSLISMPPYEDPQSVSARTAGQVSVQRQPANNTPTNEYETVLPGFIVEDTTSLPATGQMRKGEFLSLLRGAIVRTAEEELSGTIWSAAQCIYIDRWLDYYERKDSAYIERAIRKFVSVTVENGAEDYVPAICERVRRGVALWSKTGLITEVPPGVPTTLAGIPEGSTDADAPAMVPGEAPPSGTNSNDESVQAKSKDVSGTSGTNNPDAIRDQLGTGLSLGGSPRHRMESAFSADFSNVRLHTDSNAAQLSNQLNAHAFTVGEHVAFNTGKFDPGTPTGDALLAHELAHVVQQRGVNADVARVGQDEDSADLLEQDANQAARHVTRSLWSQAAEGVSNILGSGPPLMSSGLRLQRCSKNEDEEKETPQVTPQPETPEPETPKTPEEPAPPPRQKRPDEAPLEECKNRDQVEKIIEAEKSNYPELYPRAVKKGDSFWTLAKKTASPPQNDVADISELKDELVKINKGVKVKEGNCVVMIAGWKSPKWKEKQKRVNCDERIEEFKKKEELKAYTWKTETVSKEDKGYEHVINRATARGLDLYEGNLGAYVLFVESLNKPWIGAMNAGECVALPQKWKDPNIGTLPAKPAADALPEDVKKAVATVYAEQTRSSAQAQKQQEYIWFSMRKRVETAVRGPDLNSVLSAEYHAIGNNDYDAAIEDLKKDTPTIAGVVNAKKIVLDNWDTAMPADAGAFYFHWTRKKSPTVEANFNASKAAGDDAKEKEAAWKWAKKKGWVGRVKEADGWLKRIRGNSGDRFGSMYIYP